MELLPSQAMFAAYKRISSAYHNRDFEGVQDAAGEALDVLNNDPSVEWILWAADYSPEDFDMIEQTTNMRAALLASRCASGFASSSRIMRLAPRLMKTLLMAVSEAESIEWWAGLQRGPKPIILSRED